MEQRSSSADGSQSSICLDSDRGFADGPDNGNHHTTAKRAVSFAVSFWSSKSVMLLSTQMPDYKLSVHDSVTITLTLRASLKASDT